MNELVLLLKDLFDYKYKGPPKTNNAFKAPSSNKETVGENGVQQENSI